MTARLQQQKLAIGTRIAIRNRTFEVAYVDHMTLRYTPCEGGRSQRMPVETFWSLVDDGVVGFCGTAESGDNSLQLWELTGEQCDEMHRRHKYVATAMLSPRKIMAASNLRKTVQVVAEKLGDPNPPSRTTLARWLQIFAQSGGNPKQLLPRHCDKGRRETRFCFEIEAVIQETIRNDFLTVNRDSIEQVACNIIGKISERPWLDGPVPSRSSIYRRAAALDPYIVALKRYGSKFANMRFRAAGASLEATRPMQIVMMDGHRMDVLVVDTETGEILGRPYLVCLLDVASRAIVGWHISLVPFCATTALAAIKDTCSRDPASGPGGVPEVIVPDNGPDLASQALRKLCTWLGVHIEPAKAYSPNDKAHIERFFRTVNMMLIHLLPGTTFSSPSDRGEYKSGELACLTLDDVKEKFEKWLTTVYHVHADSNRAPIMAWRDLQSTYPILHFSAVELDVVARVVHRRAINKGRVLVNHLYYKSDCLATLEARGIGDVTVMVDEMDLGFVYVQHDSDPKVLYRADATRREYTRDLTQYEHGKVLEGIKKMHRDDMKALGEHTYELARWELWKDIQELTNSRSARRLLALKSQKEKTKWKREERKNQQAIITEQALVASAVPSAPAVVNAIISLPYENQTFTL
ncbi:DDE-type integrase/transposase/recombinase [Janthinobacterium sp. GMG2]|uniref:DDE-type integrase/transposase/recombinase n=1 Tax=Janthinobacterium sp. GMG2 TaxID=3096606 RepID=UPI0029F50134|nr:DDE-type integrase/transposase/recombinase [Janthinobacterium sp. GMG2]MDX8123104.1 DDE-type integrase/transposase/recombinase [Janthinobacterium sp. GMG2]